MEAGSLTESIVYVLTFGVGAIMAATTAYFKFRKNIVSDNLEINATNTYSHVITELRNELDRMKLEINEMKIQYKNDIDSLEEAQKQLEDEIRVLKNRNDSMRNEAINAFAYISSIDDRLGDAAIELKDRLMKIIVEDGIK